MFVAAYYAVVVVAVVAVDAAADDAVVWESAPTDCAFSAQQALAHFQSFFFADSHPTFVADYDVNVS